MPSNVAHNKPCLPIQNLHIVSQSGGQQVPYYAGHAAIHSAILRGSAVYLPSQEKQLYMARHNSGHSQVTVSMPKDRHGAEDLSGTVQMWTRCLYTPPSLQAVKLLHVKAVVHWHQYEDKGLYRIWCVQRY